MIRSPQALLVSLSLHLLMGMALFTFAVPGITSPEQSAVTRCRIALSQVVPALPEMVPETPKPTAKPVRKAVPEQTPVPPAVQKPAKNEPAPALQEAAEPAVLETAVVPAQAEQLPTEAEAAEMPPAAAPETAEPVQAVEPVQSSESYLNEHLAVIARLLQEHLYYPRMARKRHMEGEVLATFTVETDGTVHGVSIQKHARAILDRAAVKTIESLSGLLPHPKRALTLNVPIRFVLK